MLNLQNDKMISKTAALKTKHTNLINAIRNVFSLGNMESSNGTGH